MVKRSKKLSDKPRKKVKFQDEEILSDEASISEGLSDDFFEQTETPEEKRIRLAKKLISELESKSENRSSIAQELENTGVPFK
jgi:hypothetical protein